jgi:uncharacterized protein involved in exopolysaccharide biosynthesis
MAAPRSRKTSRTTRPEKDLVGRLADAGEEALQRLTELPGGQRALTAFNDLRSRVDELTKRVRGIEELEARVAVLEREVATLRKPKRTTAGRTKSTRSSSE